MRIVACCLALHVAAESGSTAVTRERPLKERCAKWRAEGACSRAPALMLVSCAGVCEPREVSCSRPPPADHEHELCAKLAAKGECFSRPESFLAQCFRACAMDDPSRVLAALLAAADESVPFPGTDAPVIAATEAAGSTTLTVDGHELTVEQLHAEPRVAMMRSLVSDEESTAIIKLAKPLLSPSPTLQGAGYRETTRTSTSAVLLDEDQPPLRTLRRRVANLTGYPEENLEPLQLVRYLPGQQFEAHNDFFDACDVREVFRGGERRATVLIYLNSVAADGGGATHFPELRDLRVPPKRNGAVYFENYAPNATRGDARCMHQGEPPKATTKFAVNVWVRSRRFRL